MNSLENNLKLLDKFLIGNSAPICDYLNPGLEKSVIVEFLNSEGFVHNEEFITFYQWHNGIHFPVEGAKAELIELIPLGIPYSLDYVKEVREDMTKWGMIDKPEFYLPFMGSRQNDVFLLKNEQGSRIYFSSPAADDFFAPSFKSIAAMVDFILRCYQEKLLVIDPKTGLDVSDDKKYYKMFEALG